MSKIAVCDRQLCIGLQSDISSLHHPCKYELFDHNPVRQVAGMRSDLLS